MSRPASRIAKAPLQHMRKPDPKRSARHLKFVRSLPCCSCGARAPSQAAHIRLGTDGGTGVKPSDRFTVPLCAGCHGIQHQHGEQSFWADRGVDPTGLAEHLWTRSGDLSAGTRAALRMAMTITSRRMAG